MNTELKNEISALITMTKTLLKISMRYPLDFTAGFISLLFWILMFFTAALVFASPENSATSSFYINSITWGMIIFFFINDLVWTMGVGIRYAQITGILEQTFLTPNKEHIYPLSRALRSLLLTIPFSIWALLLMELLTGAVRIVNPLLGIYILIISAIMFIGFGFLYAGLIINIKKAHTITGFFQFIIMIFCAVFFPFKALPEQLLIISKLIPFSYSVDLFRTVISGYQPELFPEKITIGMYSITSFQLEFLIIHIFTVVFLITGFKYYKYTIEKAKREGSLGLY